MRYRAGEEEEEEEEEARGGRGEEKDEEEEEEGEAGEREGGLGGNVFRSAQEPRSGTMASIPSSGSLMATHNYRRNLPKSDPGQWWASFFFGKTTHPAMTTVAESQESLGALRAATGPIACGLVAAPGAGRRRHASESSAGTSA
ncbi:pancreatic progenitor cell differentiation and proliferation factor [Turdus rufiventris]|nr:pancreatic progenitor cell differentiation and proliferation factor [Turdus rufiventris]